MKKLLFSAAAILLLAIGAMVAVYLQSGGPAPGPLPEVLRQEPSTPVPAAQEPASPPPERAGRAAGPPPSASPTAPLPSPAKAPPPPAWEAVPPVARLASLGAIGRAVNRGIAALGPQLGACFDEGTRSRFAGARHTATEGQDAAGDEDGAVVLMLELETLDDQVRIVDAPVASAGGASDGLLACAQQVLRGQTLAAPGIHGGTRHRVPYNLVP